MDKLANQLLSLRRELLAGQQQLLALSIARRDAMRTFDIARLEQLTLQEKTLTEALVAIDRRRQQLITQLRTALPRNVDPTVTEISRRVADPLKTQLLASAAELKQVVEQLERNTRINATVSEAVVKGLARVLKVVTGLAQHAGLYMRNGRKAAMHGIHLLEVTA
jgi:flagellar biosynthesis/type III secretory pathway chaperone